MVLKVPKTLREAFGVKDEPSIRKIENVDDYEVFKDKALLESLRNKIIQNIIDNKTIDSEFLSEYINNQVDKVLEGYDLSNLERNHIYNLIENEINGYGPITELLDDKNITEIMVNGPDQIYIELDGKVIKDDSVSFINNDHIIRTIQRMIGPLGRTIDVAHPMVDSRLKDGSRINAIIPPLSLNGPVLTIRKFKKNLNTMDDLLRMGTLTSYMARFLEASVRAKLNILIVGGTGSGKTTALNVLSSLIGDNERIITIEDAAELKLHQEHVITLETRTSNYDNEGEVTIRDLVINSLRMRPDRIIVGEVRSEETLDMLQAMNTGHDGSMTTAHANSTRDLLSRLETMVLMSGMELPLRAIRQQISSAVDVVVQIARLRDGSRKITSICEVTGMEGDIITMQDIFSFEPKGVDEDNRVVGDFVPSGIRPYCLEKIKINGGVVDNSIFFPER